MRRVFSLIVAVLALVMLSQSRAATDDLSSTYRNKSIEIKGGEFQVWLGQRIDQYSLSAVVDGRLTPIPFQFDEYNKEGMVYFEQSGVPIGGTVGEVDEGDRLLFMLRDAGSRKTDAMRADGKIVAEISVRQMDSRVRYVYLVSGARIPAEDLYVRYSAELGRVETDEYTLTMSKSNALNWETFSHYAYSGDDASPLDTMKLRLRGGVLVPFPRLTFNNKNFVAKPYAEKLGPIRSVTQLAVTVYILKIPVMTFDMQVLHYLARITYVPRVYLSRWQRMLLWDPTLSVSMDGNNLAGMEVRTSIDEQKPIIVDDVFSSEEQFLLNAGFESGTKWIWGRTGRNLDIVSVLDFASRELPVSLYLIDDKDKIDKPERFRGQSPNIGYQVDKIPRKGFVGFRADLFLSRDFGDGPGKGIVTTLTARPEINITSY